MQTLKRSLSMFMVLVMLVAFVPALSLGASAAEVNYKTDSNGYIYNWGTRGTVATFLSPNAEDFYEDNNTSYNELSSLSGGSDKSDAPKSELYRELQNLMKSNHDYINGYSANNNLLKYTDCQNGGGKISSFYSGNAIGPNWGEGSWNKEHTWPNSKGLEGSDEDDIMMIRPTSTSENSSRGNTAYGQSSGYYDPNKESKGAYNLHGDVARIFLYVYVRWGNINKAWGSGGVMESVEVLLAWMEEDPVDTWELGRNDSVESITGTRNVFVDYPELAFLLFGEEVPADMQTPSSANASCGHNNYGSSVVTAPTCTARGFTTYTCKTAGCDSTYKTDFVAAKGHTYTNDVCSVCGEAKPAEPVKPTYTTTPEIGKAYKLGLFSTTEYFFTGSMVSTYYGASDTDYAKGVDVYLEQANGGYYLYFKNSSGQKQYINIVASNDYRNFSYSSTATSVFVWDTAKNTLKTTVAGEYCYIGNYGSYSSMNGLKESNLKDTDYLARLYTMGGNAGGNPSDTPSTPPTDNPVCQHNYNSFVTAPTCTAGGFTTYVCSLCGNSYTGNQTTAKGHSYTNNTCTGCGATKPAAGTSTQATISFADKANRTELTKTQQVWVQNGITVTNDKTSGSADIADYSNPVRFYKSSKVTVAYPGMTKIVIACSSTSYANDCKGAIGDNATVNGQEVTVTLDSAVDSFEFVLSVGQVRVNSITVYAGGSQGQPIDPPQQCTHANTTSVGATQATCTTNGYSGNTVCLQCNAILSEGSVINALGHTDANNDDICDKCKEQLAENEGTTPEPEETTPEPEVTNPDEPEVNTPDDGDATPDSENTTENKEHTCEEVSFFKTLINSIINFFRRLFGQPEICTCGEIINKED